MRSPDERPKKEDDAPSTAIDIDSSIKRRRPKPPAYQAATAAACLREQDMRQREEERFMRPPMEEPAVEKPAFQRVPDMVPIEKGIDPGYPAQRIVISKFIAADIRTAVVEEEVCVMDAVAEVLRQSKEVTYKIIMKMIAFEENYNVSM
ncbi:unnamed protein product [Cylicocyclus nassatus]|uniref:Uncharacterized protein n=1 Tax=Cylicocyclus nassatus TaxID=53992 RepID=A0AA36H4T2_CYLNA|nr:unnamed protein product [Cylicocyclus nassatus]